MANQTRAVFLDKASLSPDDLDFSVLDEVAHWQWFDNADPVNTDQSNTDLANTASADVLDAIADAQILVTNKVLINHELINRSKHLKLICVAATGVNNVDLDAARNRGITVCNVRAYATPSVVQHVFSLILALNKKLFSYKKSVDNGDWSGSDFFCYFGPAINGLEGKTLGIIGYGELGQAVAKLAECFSMKVLIAQSHDVSAAMSQAAESQAAESQQRRVDLATLLAESDVVTLHCPLTEDNRYMIAKDELSLMKSDAILINTARGGLIDESALLAALKNGDIGAAGLDVLEQEPPAMNHPLIAYGADNLIITPHIAWASRQSRQKLVDEIAENIRAFQQGKPRNRVV